MANHLEVLDKERDHRPQRRGWAPGYYINKCCICEKTFMGDKRACECADCAYDDLDKNAHDF
jgi:hypothetical protein